MIHINEIKELEDVIKLIIGHDKSRQLENVHFWKMNSGGNNLVFNDCTLIEVVLRYPFIYNAQVTGWGDSDYVDWAWANITRSILGNSPPQMPSEILYCQLTAQRLQRRWNMLKNVILHMKDCYELASLPPAFRQMVGCLHTRPKDTNILEKFRDTSTLNNIFMTRLPSIICLSRQQKMSLEQDFLNLLLGLDVRVRLGQIPTLSHEQSVLNDCHQFMEAFDFDEMLLCAKMERESGGERNNAIPREDNNSLLNQSVTNNGEMALLHQQTRLERVSRSLGEAISQQMVKARGRRRRSAMRSRSAQRHSRASSQDRSCFLRRSLRNELRHLRAEHERQEAQKREAELQEVRKREEALSDARILAKYKDLYKIKDCHVVLTRLTTQ